MTKAELVAKIQQKIGGSKAGAEKALAALLDTITEALSDGDKVTFTGFGTFSVKEQQARTGRNPRTGEAINIPARKAVKFSVGKALKDAVK